MKFFFGCGAIGVVGIVILIIIAPYRMDRITSFVDPWSDALGTGFQIIQSLYAIGPGGLLGNGYLNSIQKVGIKLRFFFQNLKRILYFLLFLRNLEY